MEKIGILLPRSTYYSGIGFDIFEGFRLGLDKLGITDIELVTENIGFGAEKQEVYRAAERLLLQEKVKIVFAYIGQRTAQLLRPLFMSSNRLLIVLDAGSSMPQEWPTSSNILFHSLHNSLGAWLTGKLAFRDGFEHAGVSSCFYDGGYLHIFSAYQAWQKESGQIVFNHSPGSKREEFTMLPLVDHFKSYPSACLIPIFSCEFAEWNYTEIKQHFSEKLPPIYTVPFALEEEMLSKSIFPGHGIKGIASWSKHLDNPLNKLFNETVEKAGRQANLFSLLGWESANLGIHALNLFKDNNNNGAVVGEKIKEFEFDSPRGKIHFNSEFNYSISPLFEVLLEEDNSGHCKIKIVNTITETEKPFIELASEPLDGALSGWFNSYTCI